MSLYCIIACISRLDLVRVGIINILRFTLSFKLLCVAVDPPDSPDDYREARNVSYTVKSISDAYTFTFNVTWEPPIYPHKLVESYNVIWLEKGRFIATPGKSRVRYFPLSSFTSYVTFLLVSELFCFSCFRFIIN